MFGFFNISDFLKQVDVEKFYRFILNYKLIFLIFILKNYFDTNIFGSKNIMYLNKEYFKYSVFHILIILPGIYCLISSDIFFKNLYEEYHYLFEDNIISFFAYECIKINKEFYNIPGFILFFLTVIAIKNIFNLIFKFLFEHTDFMFLKNIFENIPNTMGFYVLIGCIFEILMYVLNMEFINKIKNDLLSYKNEFLISTYYIEIGISIVQMLI